VAASYGIKEGWDFALKTQGGMYGAQAGRQYVNNVEAAIEQLAKDMNDKMGSKESVDTLKGFIAEYWHADTFNINAALKDSTHRATIERSTEMGSVDVSTNFGSNFSMKYYATGSDSAKQQATNVIQAYHKYLQKSKADNPMSFEEYIAKNGYPNDMQVLLKSVYYGQGRVIPAEQLEDAIKYLERKIAEESNKEGANRVALLEGYKETLKQLTDRIKDGEGVESVPLTKDEAEAIAILCKSGDFNPEDFGFSLNELITADYILQQALKAGYTSAVITLVMQIGPEVFKAIDYLVQNGEIDVEHLKTMGLKALSSSAEGFLRGSISASLTIACQAGKLGAQFMNIPPGVVGAITVIVMDTMKNSYFVARGKMDPQEMASQVTKEILISAASIAAGTVGQTVLPEIPVLGYMLGSFVGSIVASITIDIGEKAIISFCADTGFSFFGLVEQNYELPREIIERLGLNVVSLDYIDVKRTQLTRTTLNRHQLNRTKYNTIEIKVLRRGVIGINKIGYVIT
jgi:hypothetical protein